LSVIFFWRFPRRFFSPFLFVHQPGRFVNLTYVRPVVFCKTLSLLYKETDCPLPIRPCGCNYLSSPSFCFLSILFKLPSNASAFICCLLVLLLFFPVCAPGLQFLSWTICTFLFVGRFLYPITLLLAIRQKATPLASTALSRTPVILFGPSGPCISLPADSPAP